jgi:hypothetical protein
MDVDYKKALDVGRVRADVAAKALRRWTGVPSMAVCAVKPGRDGERWLPVGEQSFKEIARDDGFRGGGDYHLLVVDEDGTAKACSRKRFPLVEALRLVKRLPLPVVAGGELSQVLQEQDLREDAREHGLHVEV